MEVRYLETAEPGLRWFRAYYRQNPQLDLSKAINALIRAEAMLAEFPMSGPAYEDFSAVREYKVRGTAFSLLYTMAQDTVWIIDLRDQRGQRSAEALRLHARELRARYRTGDNAP
ncbi:type II toxin-antitoxin system RelE/ParE family toxin [Sedimentitalea todarodis]|uniref:Type II toxin-antitoxin system RelE/ParE family toxin n=1 Tax=Sedimentitalea todarodis TaxID=1631240 RepID=A0ABU3VM08_9RHOB|nr:type II toxin-antitoxin system RelE/ParE family toxin [Sedimentitalea todarodis]MDU9007234.1 type II toxin-antitoxin system RelE/ParE family toxin [Sedimentitalea todarodis]